MIHDPEPVPTPLGGHYYSITCLLPIMGVYNHKLLTEILSQSYGHVSRFEKTERMRFEAPVSKSKAGKKEELYTIPANSANKKKHKINKKQYVKKKKKKKT